MTFPLTLAIDPATLSLIGLGLGALGGAGSLASTLLTPTPKAPSMPAPAPPSQSPVGSPTSNAGGSNPSFLAAAAAPPQQQQTASKSLLGQ